MILAATKLIINNKPINCTAGKRDDPPNRFVVAQERLWKEIIYMHLSDPRQKVPLLDSQHIQFVLRQCADQHQDQREGKQDDREFQ